MPRLTMPFPGSAAASLPDGPRRQRRSYKLDGPPGVALASSNRGRQKRVLGGSGTPSWFQWSGKENRVEGVHGLLMPESLRAAPCCHDESYRCLFFLEVRFVFKVQAVHLFGREIRTACLSFSVLCLLEGWPFPRVRAGEHCASSYCCQPSANPRLCNTRPRPLLEPSCLALHASPPSRVL